ncbi:molecular chaperone (small heat shock protein) [Thiocystis violascens DSM 198]|uniref:Molecular chaperone (Small heat shock protein) n=2 Tax=Thiocystis violascens TaxID=73141 RepID=I3YFB7_THIV6|nr:molecular chaperone (small heat shock protein) [Thiocystis violascens DSM 198]
MKTKRTELAEAVPRREMTLFDEMDRAFDDLLTRGGLRRGWLHPFRGLWPEWGGMETAFEITPMIDVIDREAEVLVRAEVPGVEKKDLEVDLAGDMLTIKGERRHEETKEEGAYFRSEIAHGRFSRTIRLPAEVAMEDVKAEAEFKDGVLEIHLPKTEKTERRRIEVQ